MNPNQPFFPNALKSIAFLGILFALMTMTIKTCNLQKEYDNQSSQLLSFGLEKKKLNKTIDEQKRMIASTDNIILYKDKQIEKQLKEIDALKSLHQKVVFSTKTVFDTIAVSVTDTLLITETDTINAGKFQFSDKWLSFSGVVTDAELKFDSIAISNQYNIEIGETKGGLFKKKEQSIFIRNENPYTSTTDISSFTLKEKPKWYQRGWTKVAAGALGMYLIKK